MTKYVPDWIANTVNSRIPNKDKDRVKDTAHRCYLGSFADLKQVTTVQNQTTETITFNPPQPIEIISSQFKPKGRGVKEEVIGIRMVGFYGISVRALNGNAKVLRQWKDYPKGRGSYGHISLCHDGQVVQSQGIDYIEESIICSPILALLEQFSFDLKLMTREELGLADYCLNRVSISVPPSAVLQIAFIPVYEQFRAEIEHDDETNWAQIGIVVAIGAAVAAATVVSAGLADGFIAGALGVTATGAAEGGAVAGALGAEGMTGAIDVAYTVLEIDGVPVAAAEGGTFVPPPVPGVPAPPPVLGSQVVVNARPLVRIPLEIQTATEYEFLFNPVYK